MDEIPMIDPPCGVWDFIWFATADERNELLALEAITATSPLTLGYKERPVQIHRSCAFPGSVRHRQEFSKGAYPYIANEYIFR